MKSSKRVNWVRFQSGRPILALYNWRDREHSVFQKFAHDLKGGGALPFFDRLAQEITEVRSRLYPNILGQNILFPTSRSFAGPIQFVPAPGRSRFVRDHAEELAFRLARIWGGDYCARALRRTSSAEQKHANLAMRSAVKRIDRGVVGIDINRPVVFVDDVLTTGSTAEVAFRSLGRPEKFEIWTVFYRPRLRGHA